MPRRKKVVTTIRVARWSNTGRFTSIPKKAKPKTKRKVGRKKSTVRRSKRTGRYMKRR